MNLGVNLIEQCSNMVKSGGNVDFLHWRPNLLKGIDLKNAKLKPIEQDVVQIPKKFSDAEIKEAYNTYAGSPYVNAYLRNNEQLSPKSEKIVQCLTQAIQDSEPIQGTFVRGITGNRKVQVNDSTIKDLIFNNSGFTSTAPAENARYAKTFALGNNSAVVEFEITEPMKAYKANSYEVIFAPNAFTADNFDVIKISDGYYKAVPKTV